MNAGILYALVTYILWGLFPIYWKQLHHISAAQLIGHRIIWAFIMLTLVIIVTGQWKRFRSNLDAKTLKAHGIASLLLSVNWLTYVWSVNNGYIIESSLGYFINPLFSVFLGMVFLNEKLRSMQWVPIVLATIGVLYLTYAYGRLPWIALILATTFGVYGLLKKKSTLGSLYGLTLETGIMLLPALAYLAYMSAQGEGVFLQLDLKTDLLLIGAGAVTAIPLLTFAKAAQRIPLTMIGLMQYIAPTGQFLIGVLLYKEAFSPSQAIGFGIIWFALIFFWAEGWWTSREKVIKGI
ncbi:MAG: EamA family transporter RarD [Anaerolineae bacterium]|jgi:chloramphenicol-sensitive protein RarD|nr:EamA family transporter RarD [Anaerolineae bacterium]MBT7070572.1 EamA family transporter RarD [Anaerolineae bacterium]MBT7324903.1 EamA family transporter RarD [Anaerolineae bacterium]